MSDIGILNDLSFFAFLALIVVLGGVVLAAAETFVLGVHWLWVLLLVVTGAGWLMTLIEPFTFAGGDSYVFGVVMSVGGLLILIGYGLSTLSAIAFGRLKRKTAL
jgi:hypothetical protein